RGLAASGRADEHHELAVLDLEVDPGHGRDVGARIPALGLLESDCCHAELLPPPAGTCRTIRSEVIAVTLTAARTPAQPAVSPPSGPAPRASGPGGASWSTWPPRAGAGRRRLPSPRRAG